MLLVSKGRHMRLADVLPGIARCPHCGIANPLLARQWQSPNPLPRGDGGLASRWAAFACSTCGSVVAAKGTPGDNVANPEIVAVFPEAKDAHPDLPDRARRYLQQAYDSLVAPDAAAVMAGSAVDAMLKELGLRDGSLYARIDEALRTNVLTQGMADWAHEVRLGSNRPRHADEDNPHVSRAEAVQSVEFAEALGQFLFVLTARVRRGIANARQA